MRATSRLLCIAVLICASAHASRAQPDADQMRVLSSRADTVSGDDALLELIPPTTTLRWKVRVNGHDANASFRQDEAGRLLALITGLHLGKNSVELATAGQRLAQIDLIDHPLSGPIFSGPQQHPFICQTELNGLGPALDTDCRAPTRVEYYYKPKVPESVDGRDTWARALQLLAGKVSATFPPGFKHFDPDHPASDVALTTLPDGRSVPYIVRRELGVINRAVYDIRFLHEPGQPLPNPWSRRESSWNGRLVYEFAGGCLAGYRQGILLGPASHEAVLAQGYAVATSTLNIFANQCNDVLSAETLSMVKEYFIKTFGAPVHTIGWGDSAGAMQQHLIAQNYPGLLDGIIPYISFPDSLSYMMQSSDCALLNHAIERSKLEWTDPEKTAITGMAAQKPCLMTGINYQLLPHPCDSVIPHDQVYDPVDHPRGVRCDLFDNAINIYGRNPRTGFAARPLDNVGVEYGLAAFNAGAISAEQFVELNELAGGYDADGGFMAERTRADPDAVRNAYRHGLLARGGGGLAQIPIIDWRWYSDDQGDNHDSFHSFVTRARLIAANGSAANQVMLIDSHANTSVMTLIRLTDPNPDTSLFARRERQLVGLMDHWLDRLDADAAPGTPLDKIARNKPEDLSEGCWAVDDGRITQTLSYHGAGRCESLYPSYGNPRTVAGGPITDDVLKCTLEPLKTSAYAHPLNADELERLKTVFPTGVCDYSKPGLGQDAIPTTWQSY